MRFRKRGGLSRPLLDVTPMADMVFLLLIFFMLSSAFLIEPGIRLKLPATKTAEIQSDRKLILSVKKTGEIFLNDRPIRLEALEKELRLLLPLHTEKLLIVRADKEAMHGIIVDILDKAKLAGAERLAIATEKK